MNYNKKYFNLYSNLGTITTTGVNFNFNAKTLLGELYDKYTAFSIKLESYRSGITNTTVVEDDYLLLHMKGLDFFNGFDSSILYNDSRVVEILDFANANQGINYISNCNAINFRRPSSLNLTLSLFYTRITTDTTIIVNPETISYVFSISGIEKYKVKQDNQIIQIPRFPTVKTINFTLNTAFATAIPGLRGRAYTYNNFSLISLIGSDLLRRYKRFNLITKYTMVIENATGYRAGGSLFDASNILMSGLNWVNPSIINANGMQTVHTSSPSIIAQVRYTNGTYRETYIENPFVVSSYDSTLTISHSALNNVALISIGGTTVNYPTLIINFDIIPID